MPESEEGKILLIEDSPTDAELTRQALKKGNLANDLVWVKDGAEALEYVSGTGAYTNRDANRLPDLILLDLNMPKVGGLEVLKKLKADARTKKIPVVVITSSQEIKDIDEAYNLGVNSYIVKPIEIDKFITAISKAGLYWMVINKSP